MLNSVKVQILLYMKYIASLTIVLSSFFAHAQSKLATELFIKINEPGKYEVAINGDYSYSRSGYYRFYDLNPGRVSVSITNNGKVYKKDLYLLNGIRTISIFTKQDGLKVLDKLNIYNRGAYNLDNWNTPLQTLERQTAQVGNKLPEKQNTNSQITNNHNREMPAQDFYLLKDAYSKINFDDERIKFLTMALKNNRVSIEQLRVLIKEIVFEDARLSAATGNYNNVFDKEKFYLLRDVFSFPSNKEKLDLFLTKQDY